MHTSTVGLPRAFARVKPSSTMPSATRTRRRRLRAGRLARAAVRPVGRTVGTRLGADGVVPAVVAAILVLATVLSWLPGMPARGGVAPAIGGPSQREVSLTPVVAPDSDGLRVAPRLAQREPVPTPAQDARRAADIGDPPPRLDLTRVDPDAVAAARPGAAGGAGAADAAIGGSFLADGTLVKPVAVDTTVEDGRHLLKIHRIAKGESLLTIAERYNVSAMTIWWANDLRSHNLVVGKTLLIPLVDGLVVTVREGDTLATLAKAHDIDAGRIEAVNELDDPVLVPGQTLVLPGAARGAIPEPTPPPSDKVGPAGPAPAAGGTPARFAGGRMTWPVIGGNQFVSRGFRGRHQGLDVAADHGTRVVAAAGGTVIFAGWKPNGGGYQIWVAHGSGIHTTYSHLSAVSVGNGQSVAPGQLIGRVGDSGYSTGPHLHFEVWHGAIWAGGSRVNPMSHL